MPTQCAPTDCFARAPASAGAAPLAASTAARASSKSSFCRQNGVGEQRVAVGLRANHTDTDHLLDGNLHLVVGLLELVHLCLGSMQLCFCLQDGKQQKWRCMCVREG